MIERQKVTQEQVDGAYNLLNSLVGAAPKEAESLVDWVFELREEAACKFAHVGEIIEQGKKQGLTPLGEKIDALYKLGEAPLVGGQLGEDDEPPRILPKFVKIARKRGVDSALKAMFRGHVVDANTMKFARVLLEDALARPKAEEASEPWRTSEPSLTFR